MYEHVTQLLSDYVTTGNMILNQYTLIGNMLVALGAGTIGWMIGYFTKRRPVRKPPGQWDVPPQEPYGTRPGLYDFAQRSRTVLDSYRDDIRTP